MNRKMKIARELIRIAKELVNDFHIKDSHDLNSITDFSVLTKENMHEIAQLCFPYIISCAKKCKMNSYDAEDAKQMFEMTLYDKLDDGYFKDKKVIKEKGTPYTYFCTIAYHTLIDYGKKNRKFEGNGDIVQDTSNYIDKSMDTVPGYELQMNEIQENLHNSFLEALEEIKKKNKQHYDALYMRFCENRSTKDIAKALNVTTDYISVVLNRRRKFIKSKMQEAYDDFKRGHMASKENSIDDLVENFLSDKDIWKEVK